MFHFIFLGLIAVQQPNPCHTVGPRLDGTRVTVCNGRVTRIEDSAGTVITRVGSSIVVDDGRVWVLEVK